jgi:hypothetical protein
MGNKVGTIRTVYDEIWLDVCFYWVVFAGGVSATTVADARACGEGGDAYVAPYWGGFCHFGSANGRCH